MAAVSLMRRGLFRARELGSRKSRKNMKAPQPPRLFSAQEERIIRTHAREGKSFSELQAALPKHRAEEFIQNVFDEGYPRAAIAQEEHLTEIRNHVLAQKGFSDLHAALPQHTGPSILRKIYLLDRVAQHRISPPTGDDGSLRPWTFEDDKTLTEMMFAGELDIEISCRLNRAVPQVQKRWRKIKKGLRPLHRFTDEETAKIRELASQGKSTEEIHALAAGSRPIHELVRVLYMKGVGPSWKTPITRWGTKFLGHEVDHNSEGFLESIWHMRWRDFLHQLAEEEEKPEKAPRWQQKLRRGEERERRGEERDRIITATMEFRKRPPIRGYYLLKY